MTRTLTILFLLLSCQLSTAATLCRIVSGGGMAFGAYDVLASSPADTLLNFSVTCDRNGGGPTVVITMRLGTGMNGTSVSARRLLQLGALGDTLSYGLYRDVSRTNVWGFSDGIDTLSRSLSVPNNGSASTTFTVYGRIPAQQDVSAGIYADIVQVTLTP